MLQCGSLVRTHTHTHNALSRLAFCSEQMIADRQQITSIHHNGCIIALGISDKSHYPITAALPERWMQDHIWVTPHQLPQDNRCNGDIAAEDVFTRHLILAHIGILGRVAPSASVAAAVWHRLVASQGSECQDDWVVTKLGGDVSESRIVKIVRAVSGLRLSGLDKQGKDVNYTEQGLCVKSWLNVISLSGFTYTLTHHSEYVCVQNVWTENRITLCLEILSYKSQHREKVVVEIKLSRALV